MRILGRGQRGSIVGGWWGLLGYDARCSMLDAPYSMLHTPYSIIFDCQSIARGTSRLDCLTQWPV